MASVVEAAVVGGRVELVKGGIGATVLVLESEGTAVHIGSSHVLTILAELPAKSNLRSVWVVCPESI